MLVHMYTHTCTWKNITITSPYPKFVKPTQSWHRTDVSCVYNTTWLRSRLTSSPNVGTPWDPREANKLASLSCLLCSSSSWSWMIISYHNQTSKWSCILRNMYIHDQEWTNTFSDMTTVYLLHNRLPCLCVIKPISLISAYCFISLTTRYEVQLNY